MAREISIHEVDDDILRDELRSLVRYFRDLGHERCDVLFGWRWGMDYYPNAPWEKVSIPLAELESEIRKVEDAGLGRLGGDDLFVTIPRLDGEFCFCHHEGIHLVFSEAGQTTADFLDRWCSAGLVPVERGKS
jgi:hypothetical protein